MAGRGAKKGGHRWGRPRGLDDRGRESVIRGHRVTRMTKQARAAYAVDGGGSHRVVRPRRADGSERTWDEPSCAIATVGQDQAIAHLRRILGGVRTELAEARALRGCIASSSYPVASEAPPPEPLVRAIVASGCTGRVVLVNDVVPLLWSDLLQGCGVIVNSGTGSAVIGRNSIGKLLKLGGHSHTPIEPGGTHTLATGGFRRP